MTPDVSKGITTLIQISGLGGLKHNTILLSWPKEWRKTKRQNVRNHSFLWVFDKKKRFRTSWSHLEHQKQLVLLRLFQRLIPIGQHQKLCRIKLLISGGLFMMEVSSFYFHIF